MDDLDREILQDRSTQDLLAQMWEAEMDRRALLKRGAVIGAGAVALAAPATAAAAVRGPAATKLLRTFLYAYAGAAPRIDNNQNNLNVATATHAVYDNLVLFMW